MYICIYVYIYIYIYNLVYIYICMHYRTLRRISRTFPTTKMNISIKKVNGGKPLIINTKRYMLEETKDL